MYVAKSKYHSGNHARNLERFSWQGRSKKETDIPDKNTTNSSNKESATNLNNEYAASSNNEPTNGNNKETVADSSNKEKTNPNQCGKAASQSLIRNHERFCRRETATSVSKRESQDGFHIKSVPPNQSLSKDQSPSKASPPSNSGDKKSIESKKSQIVANKNHHYECSRGDILSQKRNENTKKTEAKKSMTIIKPAPEHFEKRLNVVNSHESVLDEEHCKNDTLSMKPLSMAARVIQSQLSNTLGSVKRFLVSKLEECVQPKSGPMCEGCQGCSNHNYYCHEACVCQSNPWSATHYPCQQHYPCNVLSAFPRISYTCPSNYNVSEYHRGYHNPHEQKNDQLFHNQVKNTTKVYNDCSALVTSNNTDAVEKDICDSRRLHHNKKLDIFQNKKEIVNQSKEYHRGYHNPHEQEHDQLFHNQVTNTTKVYSDCSALVTSNNPDAVEKDICDSRRLHHHKKLDIFQNKKEIVNQSKPGCEKINPNKALKPVLKSQRHSHRNENDSSLSDASRSGVYNMTNRSPLDNLRKMEKLYSKEKNEENLAKLLIAQFEVNGNCASSAIQSNKVGLHRLNDKLTPHIIMSTNSVQRSPLTRKLRTSKGQYRRCTNRSTNSGLKKSCLRTTEKRPMGISPFRIHFQARRPDNTAGCYSSCMELKRYGFKVGHISNRKNRSRSSYYTSSAYNTDRSTSDKRNRLSRIPKKTFLYDSGYTGSSSHCQKRLEPAVKQLELDNICRKRVCTNRQSTNRRTKQTISSEESSSTESEIVQKQRALTKNYPKRNDTKCYSFHSSVPSSSEGGDEEDQDKISDIKDKSEKRVTFREENSFIKEKYPDDWHFPNYNHSSQKMCSNHRSSNQYTSQSRVANSKKRFIRMKIRRR